MTSPAIKIWETISAAGMQHFFVKVELIVNIDSLDT